jgi:hypothetical protein
VSRLTLRTDFQWPALREGGNVDLFRVKFGLNRWRAGVGVTVLGCGLALTWWRVVLPAPTNAWGEVIGAAASIYGAVPVESLGREHGA